MNRKVLGLLFVTLFVVMLGFSILFPVEAFYIESFGASAFTMGILIMLYSLGQFLFSPLWGRMSDRVGRKPVLMLGLGGYAVSMALFGAATELWHLFAARALAGILSSATLPTAMAVIADSTDDESRTRGMGFLGAAFGLGVIFGPAVGGILGKQHLGLPYYVTAVLAAANLAWVALMLPETLPPGRRGRQEGPAKSRWEAFHRSIAALYFLSFLVSFSLAGLEVVFGFMAANRLGLTPDRVGYLFVAMGVAGAFVQGWLLGRLRKRYGEAALIRAGLILAAAGYAWLAAAATPLSAGLALVLFAGGQGLTRPSNVSLVTRHARVGHGLAVGLLDSFDAFGRILGPLAGGLLYAVRAELPFVLGAVLTAVAGLLFVLLYRQGEA